MNHAATIDFAGVAAVPAETLARMERAGPAALAAHELLGVLGIRLDAAALAAAGGLRGVFDDPGDAVREAPFARDHMLRVQAILEIHSRWMEQRLRRGEPLGGPADTRRFIEARVRGRRSEVFGVVYLDNKNRVIAMEELFPGTVDSASVYPREVARRVLVHNAAAVLFFHNHPSGQSQPSNADRVMTRRLTEALALFDVRVLDHLVIGDGEVTSFVELGLM